MIELSQLHPKTDELLRLWGGYDFEERAFCEQIRVRWESNNDAYVPPGLEKVEDQYPWSYWLQLFLLAQSHCDKDLEKSLATKILDCFSIVINSISSPISFGTLWFEDIMAFRRYNGTNYQDCLELLETAFKLVLRTNKPAINSVTLNRFSKIYDLAAYSLVAEATEEQLTDSLFATYQVELPFVAFNFFRDVPIQMEFTYESREKWVQNLRTICTQFFVKISDFYFDNGVSFNPLKIRVYRNMFDLPVLLFAGATVHSRPGFAEHFILDLRKFFEKEGISYKIGSWNPGTGVYYENIFRIWHVADKNRHLNLVELTGSSEINMQVAKEAKNIACKLSELASHHEIGS